MNDETIRKILRENKVITVVGLSVEQSRPSYGVTRAMIRSGYTVNGVGRPDGPKEILERPCYPDLKSVQGPLGLIDVFRRPEAIPALVDEVLAEMKSRPPTERPTVLWLQEGVTHPDAEAKATAAGLPVISNQCLWKEYIRLCAMQGF